jgi:hypothetical protein
MGNKDVSKQYHSGVMASVHETAEGKGSPRSA